MLFFYSLCFKSIFAIQGPTTYASIYRLFALMVVSNTMPTWRNTTPGIISQQTSEYGKMLLTWRMVEVDTSTSIIPMMWAFNTSLLSRKAWNMWIFWTLERMFLFWVSFCWCISCWVGGYEVFNLHSAALDGSTEPTYVYRDWMYCCTSNISYTHKASCLDAKHPRNHWHLTLMALKSWLYCCLQMNGKINISCWTSSVAKIW